MPASLTLIAHTSRCKLAFLLPGEPVAVHWPLRLRKKERGLWWQKHSSAHWPAVTSPIHSVRVP